ncbi:MAG TPA: hypothetical protein VF715_00495 [Thermoleophilaceae bacterium]
MGKRGRRRERGDDDSGAEAAEYADAEGNVLVLRGRLSAGTLKTLRETPGGAAASSADMWQRRTEMLFERLAVRWDVAGLPLTRQKELLGRFRMADAETKRWVRQTIDEHVQRLGIE